MAIILSIPKACRRWRGNLKSVLHERGWVKSAEHLGVGALMFSPPTFSPSDNSTHTVGPSDSWTAVRLVLVTVGLLFV